MLFTELLLLQRAECGFHFGNALQDRLPIGQYAGLQFVSLGVCRRDANAPVEQGDVQQRAERKDAAGCFRTGRGVVDGSRPHQRGAQADAGIHVGMGERQFTGRAQNIGLRAGNFGPRA